MAGVTRGNQWYDHVGVENWVLHFAPSKVQFRILHGETGLLTFSPGIRAGTCIRILRDYSDTRQSSTGRVFSTRVLRLSMSITRQKTVSFHLLCLAAIIRIEPQPLD